MARTHKNVSKVMALIVCMTMMFTFAGGNWAFAEYDGIAVLPVHAPACNLRL